MNVNWRAEPLYFGCWQRSGHFLWWRTSDGYMTGVYGRDAATLPQAHRADFLDGVHAPRVGDTPRNPMYRPEVAQGRAAVVHVEGRTILAFWDRSVDTRGACNSAFLISGELTFEQVRDQARAAFPEVWARFPFEVVLHLAMENPAD